MASGTNKRRADLKIVLMGTMDVGKTALIHRYLEGKFVNPENTIGASFSLKQWGPFNVAIWDTAGQERFTGLSSFYCRQAGAAILAFDLTQMKTLEELSTRFLPLLESAEPDCLCVVVGTKADLLPSQPTTRVPRETALRFTRNLNPQRHFDNEVPYFETSSLTGQNVDKMFEHIFNLLLPIEEAERIKNKKDPSVVDLQGSSRSPPPQQGERVHRCC